MTPDEILDQMDAFMSIRVKTAEKALAGNDRDRRQQAIGYIQAMLDMGARLHELRDPEGFE